MRTTTTIYEVKSSVALVYSSASQWSSILAKLSKGTQVEVISISKNWAYFIYNGKDAYIKCNSIKKVAASILGTITIKYINLDTEEEISESAIYSNLELKSYTYESKSIDGYTLSDNSTKTITLTQDNPNQTITFYYKKDIIYGTITIKYLNADTKEQILNDEVYNNLELGDYTYTAKHITNYTLSSSQSVTVTLTENNTTYTVIFEYKEILGQVTIKYLDIDTNTELTDNDIYDNLPLGTYSYEARVIDNYNLYSNTTQSVTLTEADPDQTIIFEYKLETITLKCVNINPNEVPYISTYYIKPIVAPYEEVIIDYYITDYYHKEYVNEDYSEIFTVTVRIEGKDDLIIENLQAGDHSVSLGTFPNLDGQEQKFSILCTDKCGRNSHELFNFFLVRNEVPVNEYIMTEEDLITYSISNTNDTTMITNTREGLQKLLDDKQAAGYNRLKLLEGIYRIDHLGTIYIPTMFTLDMNGSTLKLHEFAGAKALMMELNNTFDSHVINGTIEGDMLNHDYDNSPNNSEWVHGISIGGESKYSSFENLTIKDITGYGTINGIKDSRDNKLGYTYLSPKGIGNTFKLGDIDRNTGLYIDSINRTTCDFIDISGYSDIGYLSVSVYLGYQGNPCGTWNLICHFYDENKNFIKSIDSYQYRRVGVPSNAKFMRVTILNEAYTTNLSIQLFRIPTHCSFKNIKFDNCRCVGLAQAAMKDMLVENCEFTKCGQSSAKCAYDAEDGWDMMQDVTFRNLNFHDNPNNEFLTCAGHNFIVENMINGDVYIWERTKDFIIKNSNCKSLKLGYNEDIVRHGVYRVYNNTIISGNINKNIGRKLTVSSSLGGIIYDSSLYGLYNDSIYNKCTIYVNNSFLGYISKIEMNNCKFIIDKVFTSEYKISFNYANDNNCKFNNCYFSGKVALANHNGFYSGYFNNCIFDDVSIQPNVVAEESDEIIFTGCTISSYSEYLIKYSPFNYTKGNYTKVKFYNCNISSPTNIITFAYGSAKPSKGYLELNNCNLTLPNLTIFFDCYPQYIENIESFNILLINTPISDNISMLGSSLSINQNITVTISM